MLVWEIPFPPAVGNGMAVQWLAIIRGKMGGGGACRTKFFTPLII